MAVIAPAIVPVNDAPLDGLTVNVYAHGRKGPGFSLGYNNLHHAIEGMLPNGTYTIEASGWGSNGVTGWRTITIKGAPIDGPSMTLVPNASIPVNVKEEFTCADNTGSTTWTINGRNTIIKGPRRYLNVSLETTDDFALGRRVSLRKPAKPVDEALVTDGATARSHCVRICSSRVYPPS